MPAMSPPPPTGTKMASGPRVLVHDLHAHRTLAGDDVRIVVRVDENVAAALRQLDGVVGGLLIGVAREHDVRTEVAHGVDLDAGRIATHHDVRPDPQPLRSKRHALGVIASGGGDHATVTILRGEARHLVVRAPHLERENRLQVLPLQSDAVTQAGRNDRRILQRRLQGDVVDARGKDLLDDGFEHAESCARKGP